MFCHRLKIEIKIIVSQKYNYDLLKPKNLVKYNQRGKVYVDRKNKLEVKQESKYFYS